MVLHGYVPGSAVVSSLDFHVKLKGPTMSDEPSISHRLRLPCAVLGGRSFGQFLGDYILENGLLKPDATSVADVGPGLADVPRSIIPVLKSRAPNLTYTLVDPTRGFEEPQYAVVDEYGSDVVKRIEGRGEELASHVRGVDLVIAVESIGDFDGIKHVPLTKRGEPSGYFRIEEPIVDADREEWARAWRIKQHYDLPAPRPTEHDSFPHFVMPTGQIAFVEQLAVALNPGGFAIVTEHSDKYPELKIPRLHEEISMSPKYLAKVADKNGLEVVGSGKLIDFLGVDPDLEVMADSDVHFHWAFGMDTLELLETIEQLQKQRKLMDLIPMVHKSIRPYLRENLPLWIEYKHSAHDMRRDLWDHVRFDPSTYQYGLFLTPDEFKQFCTQHRWPKKHFRGVETRTIGFETEGYSYMIFHNPE